MTCLNSWERIRESEILLYVVLHEARRNDCLCYHRQLRIRARVHQEKIMDFQHELIIMEEMATLLLLLSSPIVLGSAITRRALIRVHFALPPLAFHLDRCYPATIIVLLVI